MRILIIEDDISLTELLCYGLEIEGFNVDVCHDGCEALWLANQSIHDLILLDRMLPGMAGEEILKQMRKNSVSTPVIFITAIGDSAEKINSLDLGADDYLVKPFDMGELMARIRSVMRRTANFNINSHCALQFGDLKFSEEESKLIKGKKIIILTKKEAELLSYFFRNQDKVLSRRQIIGNVWGPNAEIEDGNLDNYIYLLRKRLASLDTDVKILTVHRQGYSLMLEH